MKWILPCVILCFPSLGMSQTVNLITTPEVVMVKTNEVDVFTVHMQNMGADVDGIQVIIDYDPATIDVVSINDPYGAWDFILDNSINHVTGEIRFAAGNLFAPPVTSSIDVLTIQVKGKIGGAISPFEHVDSEVAQSGFSVLGSAPGFAAMTYSTCTSDLTISSSVISGFFTASNSIVTSNNSQQLTASAAFSAPETSIMNNIEIPAGISFEVYTEGCQN